MAITAKNPAEQVKKILQLKDCPNVLLILAPDEIRKLRIFDLLLEAFPPSSALLSSALPKQLNSGRGRFDAAVKKLDAAALDSAAIGALLDDISALSLFSGKRFFLIREIESLAVPLQKPLLELIKRLSDDTKLIMIGSKLAQSNPIRKTLEQGESVIELEELKGTDLRRWVQKELKRLGFMKFSEGTIEMISALGDESPDQIVKIVEHLAVFCDSDQITPQDIQKVFVQRLAPGEFDFLEAVVQGKTVKAEVLLHNLLAGGKNPFLLLALFARSFSNYLAIKSLLQKGLQPNEIRDLMGMSPWVFNKNIAAARNYTMEKLKNCLGLILKADSRLKNRSLGNEAIFSDLLFGLAKREVVPV